MSEITIPAQGINECTLQIIKNEVKMEGKNILWVADVKNGKQSDYIEVQEV